MIQRREPLTSGPNSSVATIRMMLTANTSSAARRICRDDRNDTPISTISAGSRNSTWRPKKWNGSSPIRVATGGLAASDRMTPVSISAMIATSSGLSTVHHQSDSGVRSSRESMDVPNGQRSVPLVEEDGLRGVNGMRDVSYPAPLWGGSRERAGRRYAHGSARKCMLAAMQWMKQSIFRALPCAYPRLAPLTRHPPHKGAG